MPTFRARPYLIRGEIQHYAWGTRNDQAFIPKLLGQNIEPDKPYAELWIGAHPKAPAKIVMDDQLVPFDTLIAQFPHDVLGKGVCERMGPQLPFLFKVLSAAEALSIQAHPNKAQAMALHARDPRHYPDDNHKPEIAIALTELTALAGFKPFGQLVQTLDNYPEIAQFVGGDLLSKMQRAVTASRDAQSPLVRAMYTALMRKALTHPDQLQEAIETLAARRRSHAESWTEAERFFFDLRQVYAGPDAGLLSLFLLNLVHLQEGQGLFLESGIPHAYLRGDIVECMANSDNVVRAGLTPKFQDVDTLLESLTYATGPVDIQAGVANPHEARYEIPVPDFQLSRLELRPGKSLTYTTPSLHILLVTDGEIYLEWNGQTDVYQRGQSLLIPASLNAYGIGSDTTATVFQVSVPGA